MTQGRLYGRKVNIYSRPRSLTGGSVVWVEWATEDDAPLSTRLTNGTIHPMHAPGFRWEENVANIET